MKIYLVIEEDYYLDTWLEKWMSWTRKLGKRAPALCSQPCSCWPSQASFTIGKNAYSPRLLQKQNLDRQKWGKQSVLSKENTEGHRPDLETQKSAVTVPTIGPVQCQAGGLCERLSCNHEARMRKLQFFWKMCCQASEQNCASHTEPIGSLIR